jgi:hypothetical protein
MTLQKKIEKVWQCRKIKLPGEIGNKLICGEGDVFAPPRTSRSFGALIQPALI